jgi:hypothetical protein
MGVSYFNECSNITNIYSHSSNKVHTLDKKTMILLFYKLFIYHICIPPTVNFYLLII